MSSAASQLTASWHVRIDAALAARVELALTDSALLKPRYRSRKLLIEYLLTRWLQELAEERPEEGPLTHA